MAKWKDKPKAEQQADLKRYRASKKVLDNYRNREGVEDAPYRQMNAAVLEAEREIPWWRR
jgi:hypothetical protein